MAKNDRVVGFRFPKETWDWLEQTATSKETSVSSLVRQAIGLLKAEEELLAQLRAGMINSGISYPSGASLDSQGNIKTTQISLKGTLGSQID